MKSKIHLCFVTAHYGTSKNGPGTFANNFVHMICKSDKFKITVISGEKTNSQYGEKVITSIRRKFKGSTFIHALHIKKAIRKLNKEERIDVLYFNTFRLALFSLKLNIPYYININDYYFNVDKKFERMLSFEKFYYYFWKTKQKNILQHAACNFVNSEFTLKKILSSLDINSDNFEVTYKGIDIKKFAFNYQEINMHEKIEFITVGSDFLRKGLDIILKSLNILSDNNNYDFLLQVIGEDTDETDNFKKRVENMGLSKKVHFLGKKTSEEVSSYLRSAHIFLLPSKREALGVSIMEAAASGTTIIASKVGGIPELLKNNQEALLLDKNNSEELYRAIVKVIENKEFREKITHNAYKRSQDFSFSYVYQTIEKTILKQ